MQVKVTDEMIARYLGGKATPEEEAAVLDYMSENDEHIDDLLAMSAAVCQFRESKAEQGKHTVSFKTILSIAACVLILMGVGVALWHHSQAGSIPGVDPSPAYAAQDSIIDSLDCIEE